MRRVVDGFAGRVGPALMVALVVTLALATIVSAQPQPAPEAPQYPSRPHLFYGDVRTDKGKLLAPGSEVSAKDDSGYWPGVVTGLVERVDVPTSTSRYGWVEPLFMVPGNDPDEVDPPVGMTSGSPIAFYVLGVRAQVCNINLDLNPPKTCPWDTGPWLDTFPMQHGGYTNLQLKVAIQYTITASAGSNGSITPSGAVKVDYGFDQPFNVTAAAGYVIRELLVDGVAVPAAVNKTSYTYTFPAVTANHTISASFVKAYYTVTPEAGAGCSITPSTPQQVDWLASRTFTIAALSGYELVDVEVDTVSQGPITSYTFNNNDPSQADKDHKIAAECKRVVRIYLPLAMR